MSSGWHALLPKQSPSDYNDREQLAESLAGVDCVLLVSGIDDPAKRVGQHRNVIEAAQSPGAKKGWSTPASSGHPRESKAFTHQRALVGLGQKHPLLEPHFQFGALGRFFRNNRPLRQPAHGK